MSIWNHIKRDSAGLSLIEVVIASAIILVGVMASYALILGVQKTSSGNSDLLQAQQEARLTMESIARELREASVSRAWTDEDIDFYEPMIMFLSARDENLTFTVNDSGEPDWQKAVLYKLDTYQDRLYRYESDDSYVMSILDADDINQWTVYELIYEVQYSNVPEEVGSNNLVNVSDIDFTWDGDNLEISVRANANRQEYDMYNPNMQSTAESYEYIPEGFIQLNTLVRLRN